MTDRILLGVIGRPHGVRGLVRVRSFTADPADLTAYGPLADDPGSEQARRFVLDWRGEAIAAISELRDGLPVPLDRTAVERLTNMRLYVERDRLPPAEADEFYLADLIGLEAVGPAGALGRVAAVHDYGAGASLEIAREAAPPLLVPFTRACVPEVDVPERRLLVLPPREIGAEEAP